MTILQNSLRNGHKGQYKLLLLDASFNLKVENGRKGGEGRREKEKWRGAEKENKTVPQYVKIMSISLQFLECIAYVFQSSVHINVIFVIQVNCTVADPRGGAWGHAPPIIRP